MISSCCVFVCFGESHPVFFSSLFSLRSDLMYTWTLSSLTVQPQPNLPCFQHHITVPLFYCSFLVFMDDVCLPRRPLFRFLPLTRSAVKCISIPGSSFFFSLCGIQECYCNHLAEWQGHARASFTIRSSLLEHFCSHLLHKGHILIFSFCLFVTSSPISPYLLSLPMYTSFSPFSPHCQPRHLPASPPPSQSEERSVDIGFCPNM